MDWKAGHKERCRHITERQEQTKAVGQMFQRLSDLSMVGKFPSGGSLGEMLAAAASNPAVQQRRAHLREEKHRSKQ